MSDAPLLLVDGHNLLFRACFGPRPDLVRDQHDKRDLTTEFMFFALLRKASTRHARLARGRRGVRRPRRLRAAQRNRRRLQGNRPKGGEALKPILALPAVRRTWSCSASPGSTAMPRPTT